jgi:hypothetical protein
MLEEADVGAAAGGGAGDGGSLAAELRDYFRDEGSSRGLDAEPGGVEEPCGVSDPARDRLSW